MSAAATTCIYNGKEVSITEALEIRSKANYSKGDFTCIECGEPVKPHKIGGHDPAHIEHFSRNAVCSLSNLAKKSSDTPLNYFEINDPKAIEGYEIDRKILSLSRNVGLVAKCKKRDNYTCQSCSFRLEIHGMFIAECHHLVPVSFGKREVQLNELATLCPTCHRIAHTRSKPYSVEELRKLRAKS